MTKIKRLDRWAEKHFSGLCSEAGVTANKSDEDDTGWDYLLEFPPATIAGIPPDLQNIEKSARVQVKSKKHGKLKAKMKLSNAHRFAASPEPCFVVLAAATDGGHPVNIYAKHFWRDEIARTLKRLRKSQDGDKPTNQQTFSISFDETDNHSNDLLKWMERVIQEGGRDYSSQKRILNENLGYEDGRFHGSISMHYKDIESFVDHSIGLSSKIELTNARLIERRFGIDAKVPLFDFKPDYVEMRSHPKPCAIEIIDIDDKKHRFEGELFGPGIPGLPVEKVKARVVAGPIEAIVQGTGHAKINYHFKSSDSYRLSDLFRRASLLAALSKGKVEFALEIDGARDTSVVETTPNIPDADYVRDAALLLESLVRIVDMANSDEPEICLDDLLESWDAAVELQSFTLPDATIGIALDAQSAEKPEIPIGRFLIYGTLALGDWHLTAIVAFRLKEDVQEGHERKLSFDRPSIVKAIVDQRDADKHGKDINAELTRYANRHDENVMTITRQEDGSSQAMLVNGLKD